MQPVYSAAPADWAIEYKELFFKKPIDETVTDTNTPSQSEPESNGKEGVLHSSQSPKTGALPSDRV